MNRVREQYERACRYLAGGVSSSTRVNKALGHAMLFDRGEGCRVWDLDGRDYIDLCCSHGATLLGHGDARVRAAVEAALARGFPCSYENTWHAELAELLCQTVPCLERVRFTSSGTEATMHCLRLARAFTGRPKILKFEGNFHGYHDQVMFAIGTPADRLGPEESPAPYPGSTGLAAGLDRNLVIVPYNRPDLLEAAFQRHGAEIAAVIGEPIYYNAGCIQPTREFLDALQRLPRAHGAVLIFDEVLSAFRMAPGGAQEYLGVTPDLCTLGKAVGGGFPLSVFGGRKEIMDRLMPQGDCQHSGTYNGHVVCVAAGLAAVRAYRQPGFYDHIFAVAKRLYDGLQAIFDRHGVAARVQGLGARFGIYFGVSGPIRNYRDAVRHHRDQMLRFIRLAIEQGVYFHDYGGSACHHGFCAAMTLTDVEEALRRLEGAVAQLAQGT
ncbi:MAG: aminotransferase class III-fold pyridoxal phosphate-dependent enzyme [Gemmataceae bacterium]|nr:aminotransferase class III-fold pyridoxal phosphate-dependent enzyme [Gemmataceae bacterium]MDW8265766.1 aminotransferase class III-fold pyridoxal phosphate-dependent enzyme [Gemmataceae bacterium]